MYFAVPKVESQSLQSRGFEITESVSAWKVEYLIN